MLYDVYARLVCEESMVLLFVNTNTNVCRVDCHFALFQTFVAIERDTRRAEAAAHKATKKGFEEADVL